MKTGEKIVCVKVSKLWGERSDAEGDLEEALGSVEAASRYTFLMGSFRGNSGQRKSCFMVYISQGFIQRKLLVAQKLLQGIHFSGVHLEETLGSVEAASRYTFLRGSFRGSSWQRRSCKIWAHRFSRFEVCCRYRQTNKQTRKICINNNNRIFISTLILMISPCHRSPDNLLPSNQLLAYPKIQKHNLNIVIGFTKFNQRAELPVTENTRKFSRFTQFVKKTNFKH